MFLPSDDQVRREGIVEAMSSALHHVMTAAFEAAVNSPSLRGEFEAEVQTSVLVVAKRDGHMTGMERLRSVCPNLDLGHTVGSGHFHQLEVPDQFNPMIERFLAVALAPPGV